MSVVESTTSAVPTPIRRARAPRVYQIQKLFNSVWVAVETPEPITDEDSGRRWVNKDGEIGVQYRVIRICAYFEKTKVEQTKVSKRTTA